MKNKMLKKLFIPFTAFVLLLSNYHIIEATDTIGAENAPEENVQINTTETNTSSEVDSGFVSVGEESYTESIDIEADKDTKQTNPNDNLLEETNGNETIVVESAESIDNTLYAEDTDTREDWLHYSIDLVWDIADVDQKYNQSVVVTNNTAILQPTYTLTVQTSSVIYAPGQMEIRIPRALFTKRTYDVNNGGETVVYPEPNINPVECSAPKYPEVNETYSFSYQIDEETNELVFINNKTIPAGTNETIQVRYNFRPSTIIDLSVGSLQAKAVATPTEYPDERLEKTSPTITYKVDTGFSTIEETASNRAFEEVVIKDGYRYYRVNTYTYPRGCQPYIITPAFDFDGTGGEIVGPRENMESGTTMSAEEAAEYYKRVSYIIQGDVGSTMEGSPTDDKQNMEVYVRYPETGEVTEDRLNLTFNLIGNDPDDHTPPADMNDYVSRTIPFKNTWARYPDKPIGEWLKTPIGQERTRADFTYTLPSRDASKQYVYGASRYLIGVQSESVFPITTEEGTLVITDTGLEPLNGAPDIDYEFSFVSLPILKSGAIRIFDETTMTSYATDHWFDNLKVEAYDGSSWQIIYEGDGTGFPNGDNVLTTDIAKWNGHGFTQVRATFTGVKKGAMAAREELMELYAHAINPTKEYLQRQELDQYRNWMTIGIYDSDETNRLSVRDWADLTLKPTQTSGSASLLKSTTIEESDTVNEQAVVGFRISGEYHYQLVNMGTSISSPAYILMAKDAYKVMQSAPEFFEEEPTFEDIDALITYDLLPEGYTFKEVVDGNAGSQKNQVSTMYYYTDLEDDSNLTEVVDVIDNYKGTNRQLVIFRQDLTQAKEELHEKNPETAILYMTSQIHYTATIPWDDLIYFQHERNLVTQMRSDGKEIYGAYPDDGTPNKTSSNLSVFEEALDENGNPAFRDINGDGDTTTPTNVYAYVTVSPNVVQSASTGINKHIKGDGGRWTDLDKTDINRRYQYRVRVANGDSTYVKDLIIYDTLEDAANTELASGEVTWKGIFHSVDISNLRAQGYDPIVYDSPADVADLDYNIVTGREDEIWIDDPLIWSTELPENLEDVTAVAVDIRKMADGSEAILQPNSGVQFIINMTAPPEYPTLYNPEMIYAINRPAYHSYQYVAYQSDGEYFTDIGRRVKIYLEPAGTITVKKTSEEGETPADTKFVVTGPDGFEESFVYADMIDGVYEIKPLKMGDYTIVEYLNGEEHSWKVNVDGASNVTSVYEDGKIVTSAETSLESGGDNNVIEITNHYYGGTVEVKVKKTWEDNQDEDGSRPDFVTIQLLADGEVVQTQRITADDNWEYVFKELPKYNEQVEINYTVEEELPAGYTKEIKGNAMDGYEIVNSHTPEPTPTPTPDSTPTPTPTPTPDSTPTPTPIVTPTPSVTPTPKVTKKTTPGVPTPYTADDFNRTIWLSMLISAIVVAVSLSRALLKINRD